MITNKQLKNLRRAVKAAAEWRGNLIGATPPEALDEFDAYIKSAKEAVKAIGNEVKRHKNDKKAIKSAKGRALRNLANDIVDGCLG